MLHNNPMIHIKNMKFMRNNKNLYSRINRKKQRRKRQTKIGRVMKKKLTTNCLK